MLVKKKRFKVVHTGGVSDLGQPEPIIKPEPLVKPEKKVHGNTGKKYAPRKDKGIPLSPEKKALRKGKGGRKKGFKHSPETIDKIYATLNRKYQEKRAAALGQSDNLTPKSDK